MKTRIKEIIIVAAALIFASSGLSFAQDWNDRNQKTAGKAYGHYKVQKQQPGWSSKPFKSSPRYSRYVYKKARDHRYYDDHHRRPAPRRHVVYKSVKKDPIVVFKVILKDHR